MRTQVGVGASMKAKQLGPTGAPAARAFTAPKAPSMVQRGPASRGRKVRPGVGTAMSARKRMAPSF